MSDLSIVAYHYVRPLARTRFPQIKGCDREEFVSQIDLVVENYQVVSAQDLIAYYEFGEALPPKAVLLTFDDGFRDHFDYALPVLVERGISGCFYAPAAPVLEHRLLDVHKIHFLLASAVDPLILCDELDRKILERSLGDPVEFARQFRHPSPRDPAEVIYFKRMLQRGLPEDQRSAIADDLFSGFVSADQAAFAEELYLTTDQLRLMHSLGMHVGSHGFGHYWLSTLSVTAQRTDIKSSVDFLQHLEVWATDVSSICYPYGDHSESTRLIAKDLGFGFGLADHHGVASLQRDDRWALPRISTSDFRPRKS